MVAQQADRKSKAMQFFGENGFKSMRKVLVERYKVPKDAGEGQ